MSLNSVAWICSLGCGQLEYICYVHSLSSTHHFLLSRLSHQLITSLHNEIINILLWQPQQSATKFEHCPKPYWIWKRLGHTCACILEYKPNTSQTIGYRYVLEYKKTYISNRNELKIHLQMKSPNNTTTSSIPQCSLHI